MTRLIGILVIVVVLWIGYALFKYWEKVSDEQYEASRRAKAVEVTGESLSGLPQPMEHSLREAEKGGANRMREWLKASRKFVQDPRLAWIELDYVVKVSSDDPTEAKRIFAEVRQRTPTNSPVYPRIQRLQKTYE